MTINIIDRNSPPPQGSPSQEKGFWDTAAAKLTAFVLSIGLATTTSSIAEPVSKFSTMAVHAQNFVNSNIIFSSTFPNRNVHFSANNSSPVSERIDGITTAIEQVRSSNDGPHCSTFVQAVVIGMKALKYSIGNCMEMSAAAFVYLMKSHPEIKMDLFHIKGGDHCFLVIGRDFDSDPTDPTTWGKNALICDPWSKQNYPASKMGNLKDYVTTTIDGNPVLRDFDLKTQTLEMWTSNQYTVKDLESLIRPHPSLYVDKMIGKLTPHLQNFHFEKTLAKKQEAAKAIQKLIEETPFSLSNTSIIAFQNAQTALYDQVEFFLEVTNCTSSLSP